MPRYTYGPDVKARVKRLFEALLDFANREWEFDESDSKIQVNWQAEDSANPKLVVRTTLADLYWLTKKDKYPGELTKPQIREALKILKDFLKILEDNRTKTQGVDTWHFTLRLWSQDKEKNLQQFEQAWEDSRPDKSKKLEAAFKEAPLTPQFWGEQDQTTSVLPPKVGGAGGGIDWRDICRAMLEKQKRLTTNELLSADEDMKFELDDIHVPLALVQRTKPDKRSGDVSPEEGSRLLQPSYEEKQRFRHEEFLAQVLQEGKGQSKGRRIAVIGEPGAGKTTLLQSIAFWLFEDKNQNLGLPIWISLADLQGKTLEEYLLQRWLKNALEAVRVTPEQENALVELFKQERVWLFLDGVDEIAGSSLGANHELPLQMVASQLEGWVAKARVLLSCRLNVWEANINALGDDFEKYRLLDFDYPLQVKEFICRWFRKTDADKGERLWTELDKSERQRIQDLVKNPLRLALLCSTWQSSDKGLPSTKAGLYQRFVEVFYTWKKNRFPTTFEQRQELNAALGRLALRAIDSEESRFRLRHKVVCEVLGDPEQENSLFGFALQLGWLNQVGLAAESETQEKVYAFYHPTFQEYFAAVAISDWDFFLPRAHKNRPVEDKDNLGHYKPYRIFEPQWKEIFLLWVGRGEVEREQLIKALVEFEDGCQDFYKYRAFFLAAIGISEFKSCSRADEIVTQIVQWNLGHFNEKQKWITSLNPIEQEARTTILQTDYGRAIETLINSLKTTKNEDIRRRIAYRLGEIGTGNQKAIQTLVQILKSPENYESYKNYDTCKCVAESLEKIDPGNPQALQAFVWILVNPEDDFTEWRTAERLEKVDPGKQQVIQALFRIIETTEDEYIRGNIARNLGKCGTKNQQVIEELFRILETTGYEYCRIIAAESLGKVDPGNQQAIKELIRILETTRNESIRIDAKYALGEIGTGNPEAIQALVQILVTTEDENTRRSAAYNLGKIGTGNPEAIQALVQILVTTKDEDTCRSAAESLGKINPGNPKAIETLVQILVTTKDEDTRRSAAESLGTIGTGNQQAIQALVQILKTTQDEDTRRSAAYNLGKIDTGNPEAIEALVQILVNPEDKLTEWRTAESLEKIDPGNQRVIQVLVRILETTEDEDTRWRAAESLGKIDSGNQRVIQALVQILEATEDENTRWRAAYNLGKIDTGNQQAIQALARILETTEDEDTRWRAAESLGKIDSGNQQAIQALVQILETAEDEDNRGIAAYSLGNILQKSQMPSVVSALQQCLADEVYQTNFGLYSECYDLIWYCAQNMTYPAFYQAWHQQEEV